MKSADEKRAMKIRDAAMIRLDVRDVPHKLTYEQAERLYDWAPCQVRYGQWPNGAVLSEVKS